MLDLLASVSMVIDQLCTCFHVPVAAASMKWRSDHRLLQSCLDCAPWTATHRDNLSTHSSMAKGTLAASATATKKGSVSTRGGSKNGKSSIVGSQEGSSTSTTAAASKGSKKAKTAAAAPANKKKAVAAAPAKPAVSDESADDDDEVVFVERDSKDGAGPRHLDPKGKKYDKHYKAVVRDALGGMDLCTLLLSCCSCRTAVP